MHTVVELPEFIKQSKTLLSKDESTSLIAYLSVHPKSGVLIQGTGGIRKLRWASGNKGKSGSTRVIYFYHNSEMPIFLITAFGKNQKANLSQSEKNMLAKLTQLLIQKYGASL
ncbi:MAG: type II toxin-antitoxin system RelE/ParE family toxin [Pseudomonadales bacterium]|nr:type II toxin-antitoxin system RelE/ParE family toxin [Pseudomonadales bacterium]